MRKGGGRSGYEGLSWRDLLVKMELETQLEALQYNPDFKALYLTLERAMNVESLMVPVIPKTHIKSGHYWLMVVLSKLPAIKRLQLYTPLDSNAALGLDGMKYLVKGLANFKKNGGALQSLEVVRTQLGGSGSLEEKFGNALRIVGEDLTCLSFRGVRLTKGMATSIAKVLSDNKRMTQLSLQECSLGVNEVKEVADGLMRAKQLQRLNLSGNPQMGYGVNYILYNLAFSPKITHIDISETIVNDRVQETVEALYKLLKISGSLETLILTRSSVVPSLSQ